MFTWSWFVLLFSIHHEPTDKLAGCGGKESDSSDEQNGGEIELKLGWGLYSLHIINDYRINWYFYSNYLSSFNTKFLIFYNKIFWNDFQITIKIWMPKNHLKFMKL